MHVMGCVCHLSAMPEHLFASFIVGSIGQLVKSFVEIKFRIHNHNRAFANLWVSILIYHSDCNSIRWYQVPTLSVANHNYNLIFI